jgi:hypothetical protein
MRADQIEDLKIVLRELNPAIKLVCVCGNHDVGDIPTPDTISMYKKEFGEDYFSFWCNGCKFICLNSQLYFNSSRADESMREQDAWLEGELNGESERKHVMVFQHIPLFTSSADEPFDNYFNIEPVQRRNLVERFKKAGVRKVFCGHFHKNAGGFDGELEVVVTSAIGAQLGKDKHGYRLVEVGDSEVKHKYVEVTDQAN